MNLIMIYCEFYFRVVNWSMEKFITRTILRTKVSDSSYVKETVGYNYFHINYCYFNMQWNSVERFKFESII
ncbi:hypothetical protein HanOQP8_Chr03g0122901 [Helianthus annuus]|nr:hypothetical protein HanOQP8_Chr03g0122901 [Helianthus annuus]